MPELQLLESSLPLSTFTMLAMYLVLALYAMYSAVFYYHWKSYGTDGKITGLTLTVYAVTTIPLAAVIVSLALLF